jgi:hypothetical protein
MKQKTRRATSRAALAGLVVLGLSVLGIQPAFAAPPTITSFSPACGPAGTAVTITGSGFDDAPSPVSSVTFNNVAATFTVDSNTQITATVPATATTGPIEVTDTEGTVSTTTNFSVTASDDPTIASFAPTSGSAGTVVTITGACFTGATAVRFGGVAATTFVVDSDTQITATVPAGAVTGPIEVTTPAGTGTSGSNFTVTTGRTEHARTVTLRLKGHLTATGRVKSDLDDCTDGVTVKIQRRKGGWKTVRSVETTDVGRFTAEIKDRTGRYRALVPAFNPGPNDGCLMYRSPIMAHKH